MKKTDVYKCDLCGNVVEVLNAGGGELVCCGQPMKLMDEKTADSSTEKHVPIVEEIDGGIRVKVGSVDHPMTDEHYIQWIEVINGDYVNRMFLKPGFEPHADFYVPLQPGLVLREMCNVHGLWKHEL